MTARGPSSVEIPFSILNSLSRMLRKRVPVVECWGPSPRVQEVTRSCCLCVRKCPTRVQQAVSSVRGSFASVAARRDPRRVALLVTDCCRFWSVASSSRVKSVSRYRHGAPGGRHPRNVFVRRKCQRSHGWGRWGCPSS